VKQFQPTHAYFCAICGHALDLETCKINEHGTAVHGNCYVRVALANESNLLIMQTPAHGNALPSAKRFDPGISDEQKIRELAFRLYEEHGRIDGYDVQDWLEAEAIVREPRQFAA
jgi:Protein of unknown function (DUF2934)